MAAAGGLNPTDKSPDEMGKGKVAVQPWCMTLTKQPRHCNGSEQYRSGSSLKGQELYKALLRQKDSPKGHQDQLVKAGCSSISAADQGEG